MQHLNEWVQVASFTTVVHARPSSSSPVISAYPIGQELRVIARESGFARVQDLGSGHLGWITEAALRFLAAGNQRTLTPSRQKPTANNLQFRND